jgi:Holliday junction resolvasome RuvABC endonuclease subunit
MKEFEANNPDQLKLFLKQLNELVDEFHPNIYLIDEVFEGIEKIEKAIKKEIEL